MSCKFSLLAATALLLTVPAAYAEGVPHPGLRFMMTAGVSKGGDKLTTAQYTDGSHANIQAGDLALVGIGLRWRKPESRWSAQLTANYHSDWAQGENGRIEFNRYPIELLAHYHFADAFFAGGGLRYSTGGKLRFDIDGNKVEYKMDGKPGAVAELGYSVQDSLLLTLRYVAERYEAENGAEFDGNHVGVNASLLF